MFSNISWKLDSPSGLLLCLSASGSAHHWREKWATSAVHWFSNTLLPPKRTRSSWTTREKKYCSLTFSLFPLSFFPFNLQIFIYFFLVIKELAEIHASTACWSTFSLWGMYSHMQTHLQQLTALLQSTFFSYGTSSHMVDEDPGSVSSDDCDIVSHTGSLVLWWGRWAWRRGVGRYPKTWWGRQQLVLFMLNVICTNSTQPFQKQLDPIINIKWHFND